jgi:hypothetical protein
LNAKLSEIVLALAVPVKKVENQGNPTDENTFAQKCRGTV